MANLNKQSRVLSSTSHEEYFVTHQTYGRIGGHYFQMCPSVRQKKNTTQRYMGAWWVTKFAKLVYLSEATVEVENAQEAPHQP